MNIEVLKDEKDEIELTIDNMTLAEVLRVYLYKQDIEFAAWRTEHPSKPLLFRIKSSDKNVKKVIGEAVSAIKKDCDKIVAGLKK